jgi:SAM-dependent methyltransferase
LIFYKRRADKLYWDEFWRQLDSRGYPTSSFYKDLFRRYLPISGKLLDVGCGLGQNIKVLANMGRDIDGVDFSTVAVRKAKQHTPENSLIVGDVLFLPYRNSCFCGCISLGVVEHFEEGPENALREINRVMKKGGILLVTVPFFNPLRQIKDRLGFYTHRERPYKNNQEFYQYAFTIEEFTTILKQCGFFPYKIIRYDVINGLRYEIPFINIIERSFEKKQRFHHRLNRIKKNISIRSFITKILEIVLCNFTAHTLLFVAKKE